MSDESARLPTSMALAWGVAQRPGRGPRRVLSLEAIVTAGRQIAVADGLGAVSMARVAERVGVSTMALYRYVPSKDDLLVLMIDDALGRPPVAVVGESWRAGLRRWAVGARDGYRANPWTLRVPVNEPPMGPNNMRWLENALAALQGTPLTARQKISCVITVACFVRSEELLVMDQPVTTAAGEDQPDYPSALQQLLDPREFPLVAAALQTGAMNDDEGIDGDFEFGIERILDGIAVLIDRPGPVAG